jgi:hypothetical protein
MYRITFDPFIPLSLWFPLALVAGGLLAWYGWSSHGRLVGRRWWGVIALMTVAVALPLGILLNPTWVEQIPPPPGKPLLTVLVDHSASMATRDAPGGRSRYEEAVDLASAAVEQLNHRYAVSLRTFAAESKSVSLADLKAQKPEGATTDLASALEQSLTAEGPQGQAVVLLSDGIHNAGSFARLRESLAKAKASAAPIFTQTLGGTSGVKDLEVELNLPQELAFAAQQVPVTVNLRERGDLGPIAKVSLVLDGKTLAERDVTLTRNGSVETTFSVAQKKSGLYRYEVRAAPLAGEVTTVNNSATLLLRVIEEPIRVLLLEGKPYWDTKYLIRTLAADPSIELTSVVRLTEGRLHQRKVSRAVVADKSEKDQKDKKEQDKTEQTSPSPATPNGEGGAKQEENTPQTRLDQWAIEWDARKYLTEGDLLGQFQIVVLGRDAEMFLSDAALGRLKKWLAEGDGSLVCFRGAPASQINERLGQLLPVRWEPAQESRFHIKMTGAGQALRWLPGGGEDDTLLGMPSLATVAKPGAPKALAVVLAAASEGGTQAAPVITYQPVGSGRVVVVEGAGMWRWAFLPPTHQDRDDIYATLWRSLIRWMVSNVGLLPSQQLALRTDTTTFSTEEAATAMLLVREDKINGKIPEVELSGGTLEKPRRVEPVPSGGPGQYRLGFGRLAEGHYKARVVGGPENDVSGVAEFDVRGNLRERLDVEAQPNIMRMIADLSGGEKFSGKDLKVVAHRFDEHLVRSRPARSTQSMAWDRWWVLLGVFSLWGFAWGLRRWSGVV